jgi:hypothetical protein
MGAAVVGPGQPLFGGDPMTFGVALGSAPLRSQLRIREHVEVSGVRPLSVLLARYFG